MVRNGRFSLCVCREEFEAHGLSEVITLECRDVCSDGFNLTDAVDAGKCVLEQQGQS